MPDLSLFDLTGRKVLVTGEATGIGRGGAEALARAGAAVAIADRDPSAGTEAAAELAARGHEVLFVQADVSRRDDVEAMIETVVGHFGRLDVAVNNAGIFRPGRDEEYALEDWNAVMAVNLTGTWLCACAEMRQMIRQTPVRGKIINIASIAASIACSNGAYDTAKAGVVHLSRTLAARWGRFNMARSCSWRPQPLTT